MNCRCILCYDLVNCLSLYLSLHLLFVLIISVSASFQHRDGYSNVLVMTQVQPEIPAHGAHESSHRGEALLLQGELRVRYIDMLMKISGKTSRPPDLLAIFLALHGSEIASADAHRREASRVQTVQEVFRTGGSFVEIF